MTLKLIEPRPEPEQAQIIPFERKPDQFERDMLEVIELHKQGKVKHFVAMWQLKESPTFFSNNWWGESCVMCLGMANRLAEEINRWINGEVED